MKKTLTLILAICLITACAIPVGANNVSVSEGLQTIRRISMLGEESSIYDSEQTVTKEATSKGSSIEHLVKVTDYVTDRLDLFSFEFKTLTEDSSGNTVGDDAVATSFLIGQGKQQADAICALEFREGKIYIIESDGDSEVEGAAYTCGEYVKVQVLADKYTEKYYVWFGDKNVMTDVPDVDGRAYRNSGKTITHLRIWRASHKTAGTLYVDNFSITPLVDTTLIPAVEEEADYAYNETFSYTAGAYNADNEPWNTLKNTVLVKRGNSNAQFCNPEDFVVNSNGELVITTNNTNNNGKTSLYHNWYFTNDTAYKTASPDANKLVIQADIKSDKATSIHLGSYAASAVRVRVTDNGSELTARYGGKDTKVTDLETSFVHSEGVETAPYTTLTFFIEETCYSLWMDNERVITKKLNNASEDVDSISFVASEVGQIIYVNNIRVFEAPADFMNVYGVTSSTASIDSFITSGVDGVESFADTTYVDYCDSKGYYNGTNIVFPLFSDTAYVRAVVSSGDYAQAYYSDGALTFPSGYTDITRIVGAGTKTASFDVILRNDASARTDELIVMAAAYDDDGKIIKIKNCTFDGSAFVADFGDGVAFNSAEAFVWEKGTLRPVQ